MRNGLEQILDAERHRLGVLRLRGARATGFDPEELLQLAGLIHLGDDVAATNQLALDEQLRDRRPPGDGRELLADRRIGQDVDGGERLVERFEDRSRSPRSRTAGLRARPS